VAVDLPVAIRDLQSDPVARRVEARAGGEISAAEAETVAARPSPFVSYTSSVALAVRSRAFVRGSRTNARTQLPAHHPPLIRWHIIPVDHMHGSCK
jgi:hypothetical protein